VNLVELLLLSQSQIVKYAALHITVEVIDNKSFEVFPRELELRKILKDLSVTGIIGDKKIVKSLSLVGKVAADMHKESMLKSYVFIIQQQLKAFSKGLDSTVEA